MLVFIDGQGVAVCQYAEKQMLFVSMRKIRYSLLTCGLVMHLTQHPRQKKEHRHETEIVAAVELSTLLAILLGFSSGIYFHDL